MKLCGTIFRRAFCFSLVFLFSCVEVPLEVELDREITISEKEINELSDKILNQIRGLAEKDFGIANPPANMVKASECKRAFNEWIAKQFDLNLIPKRVVLGSEYGASSTDPLISQCYAIDLELEFNEALKRETIKESKKPALLFPLSQLSDAFAKTECSKNFIDPKKRKLRVTGISLRVKNNTLNINAPTYRIYYSTRPLNETELVKPGAEEELISNGVLKLLTESPPIPPRFTGLLPMKNTDSEAFENAQDIIASFASDLIATPTRMDTKAEIKVIDNEEFYVVPRGMISMSLDVALSVKAEIGDALCALREFKAKTRKKNS